MRPLVNNPASLNDMPSMSPFDASFALGVQESPFEQIGTAIQKYKASAGPKLNHVELNAKYPDMDQKFTESMAEDQAAIMYDRFKVRRELQRNIELKPGGFKGGFDSFAGSVVGSLVDPVGNAAMVATGGALSAAGVVGKTLGQRIGVSILDNFVGNMAADLSASTAGKYVGDQVDIKERFLVNAAASTLFGVPLGAMAHYFRASPKLGEKLSEGGGTGTAAVENRAASGLDPEGVKTMFDAQVAAEMNGVDPAKPYVHGPVNLEGDFYSGSMNYTEDFQNADHAVRSDIGHERGVLLTDKETVAHSGALTAESGDGGSVFTHNIKDKKILNGETKLSEIPDTTGVVEQALDRHTIKADASKAGIIETLLKSIEAHKSGKLAVDEMKRMNNGMVNTVLNETLQHVGLYDAYKSFEAFARGAGLNASDLPYYSIRDAITTMEKRIGETTDKKLKKILVTENNKFLAALRTDYDTRIADLGYTGLVNLYHKLTDSKVVRYTDISIKDAYKEVLRGYYAGKISLADVMKFENSLNADGIHFTADNFRGQKHDPFNAVYMFEKNYLEPKEVKSANPEFVGKMTSEKLAEMNMQINGEDRLFKPLDNGTWKEVKIKKGIPDKQMKLPMNPEKEVTAVDTAFNDTKKVLEDINQFEEHLSAEDVQILKAAQLEFSDANKMEQIINTVKGCLK